MNPENQTTIYDHYCNDKRIAFTRGQLKDILYQNLRGEIEDARSNLSYLEGLELWEILPVEGPK